MQSPRLYFSRLGIASLRRSASSATLSIPEYSIPGGAFNTRHCSYQAQPSAVTYHEESEGKEAESTVSRVWKVRHHRHYLGWRPEPSAIGTLRNRNSGTVVGKRSEPSDNQALKVRNARTMVKKRSETSDKQAPKVRNDRASGRRTVTRRTEPSRVPAHPEYLPKVASLVSEPPVTEISPIVRWIHARSRRQAESQKVWSPEKTDDFRDEKSKSKEHGSSLEETSPNHTEGLSEDFRRDRGIWTSILQRRNHANRQRLRRQRTRNHLRIRWQLEAVEQQLGMLELRIEAWRQLASVEKLLSIIEKQLEMVERHIEAWRQLDKAEKQLSMIERQLELAGRRIEVWRELNLVGGQLSAIERQVETTRRRIEARRQLDMVEKELSLVDRELEPISRRLAAWRPLDMAEKQVKVIGQNPKVLRRRVTAHRWRRRILAPSAILARWLDTDDVFERENDWLKSRRYDQRSSLSVILLVYLRQSADPMIPLDEFDQSILKGSTVALQRRGFTMADVAEWARIVSTQDRKVMIELFVSSPSKKPTFLLLEILRRDILDVRSLKLMLIYCWDQLQGKLRPNLITAPEVEIDSVLPGSNMTQSYDRILVPSIQPSRWQLNSSFAAVHRLLYQARRIWPAAIVSISHLIAPSIQLYLGSCFDEYRRVDNQTHHRLCYIYNQMLRALALPSRINPFKSMVYNWQAQRVLLEMSTHFQPRLILDRFSYRAVAQVLAASKKSERESRAATLRERSWPPWRVEQDGMDAQRLPQDDLSRVVATGIQAKMSGYNEEREDRILGVLGGQEPDRTPTIPTRKLIAPRKLGLVRHRRHRMSSHPSQNDSEAEIWAARIESTRDVQEAWSAFIEYQEGGRQPTMSMYFAMIAKLQFEGARIGRGTQHKPSPGDGKEVFPPSNDNFSSFYQSRLQPPTSGELYEQMRRAGIRPSGRFLTFLVEHARNPHEGINFLRDSRRTSRRAIAYLEGFNTDSVVLKSVPKSKIAAFITLLCRFVPRVVPATVSSSSLQDNEGDIAGIHMEDHAPRANKCRVVELRPKYRNQRHLNPLLHCINLLQIRRIRFRPTWYAVFSSLAREGTIIDRSLIGDPKNDILAWKVLVASLGDFHNCGLELDPQGFLILCIGLEKALMASAQVPEEERDVIFDKSQAGIAKNEFMKLSELSGTSHPTIPKLLHFIEGAHLHAYVRVLGLVQDYDGLMYVLQWMVQNHTELDHIAAQSNNGSKLIRRTIIAMKVFLGRTEHESKAEDLVDSFGGWGLWPQDPEAQDYINLWPRWAAGDGGYVMPDL